MRIVIEFRHSNDPRPMRLVLNDWSGTHFVEVCETDRLGLPSWRPDKSPAGLCRPEALIGRALFKLAEANCTGGGESLTIDLGTIR